MNESEAIARELSQGGPRSANSVLPLIYGQLRALAATVIDPGLELLLVGLLGRAFQKVEHPARQVEQPASVHVRSPSCGDWGRRPRQALPHGMIRRPTHSHNG